MTEKKGPLDQALDLFVYAPLGLALSAGEELPRLAERGRATAGMAGMVGRFVVAQGRREAEKVMGEVGERLAEVVGDFLGSPAPASAPAPASTPAPAPAPGATASESSKPPAPAPAPAKRSPGSSANGTGPSASSLAIPGYDSLAASQVVQRLAGLSRKELEAVRAYEEATRGRKTILNRVAQLQADAPA